MPKFHAFAKYDFNSDQPRSDVDEVTLLQSEF